MKIIPKLGFCVIYHPFEENANKALEIFEESNKILNSLSDVEVIKANNLITDVSSAILVGKQFKKEEVDVICVKLATWSSDNPILDMSAEFDVPFIFWTYPHIHAGSLCGGQQFNMVFKELKKECIFVYKDDEKALKKIKMYAECIALRNKLKTIKLCRIGNRTQGMSEVICDEFSVKEVIGPRIYTIGFDEFKEIVNRIDNHKALLIWQKIKAKVNKISVSDSDGILSVNNYLALKKLIKKRQISGFTIECYPRNMGEACLGFSLLADEGIPGACEGDINSLVLMYILTNLSRQPVHNIDILFLYEDDNSILGSHCGCGSFNLAISLKSIELAHVRLANKGLCVLFPSKSGKVTLANLVGRKGTYRMGVIRGEAIETTMVFPGNPIRIKIPISIDKFLKNIEKNGLGHHWIVAYGHYVKELELLAKLLKIELFKIK
ncbi:MAG: hypothetical protein ACTSPD_00880 [Promethearchaeota archaeon]